MASGFESSSELRCGCCQWLSDNEQQVVVYNRRVDGYSWSSTIIASTFLVSSL